MIPAITPATRTEAIGRLRSETFDVLILGGGINGAGTARDLALRSKTTPLNIALVEQNQFGSGTSSRNSHLIHGGLRYLKMLDFSLVRESLAERETLLRIAPHLVDPLPFLMPIAGLARELFYNTGLTLYDLLSRGGLPGHRRLSLAEVHLLEPGLAVPGMTGGAEYYDAEVRSARLVLENVFEAVSNGAACANYLHAESHARDAEGIWRVLLHDRLSGESLETRARDLIDATGPWARHPAPRLVRGSHIVLPRLNSSSHAIAYFEESGRIIFFIPWGERRDRTLIGTTDVDHPGSPDDVHISADEVAYLRNIAARVFPESASLQPLATFSSLRPLLASSGSATRATRDHKIFRDPEGILHITGGKYTTYRAMSEEAANLVAPHAHLTAELPLNGNTRAAIDALIGEAPTLAAHFAVDPADVTMLIHQYGVLTPAVLACAPGDLLKARALFAIRHEMSASPADFLDVSTSLAHEGRPDLPAGVLALWPRSSL